jgi:hypothetical protein
MEKIQRFQFGADVGDDFHTQMHVCFGGSFLNDLVGAFELQIGNGNNNHDVQMDAWTFESSVCVRRIVFFCCLVLVSHCHRHVPLIASTRVWTIVL